MDKNFVNIDDLVRQRLGGGEEQERSGAWLRMQDLLDKEMPRDKFVGMLYWRRFLSAMAVLLLVGTIAVGGYELSAYKKANSGNTDAVAVAAPPTTAALKDNEVNTTQLSTPDNTDNHNAQNNGPQNKQHHKLIAASGINRSNQTVNDNKNDKASDKQLRSANNNVTNSETVVGNNTTAIAANETAATTPAASEKKVTGRSAREAKPSDVASENEVASADKKESPAKAESKKASKAITANDVKMGKPSALKETAAKGPAAKDQAKTKAIVAKTVPGKAAHKDAVADNSMPAHKSPKHEAKAAKVKTEAVAKVNDNAVAKGNKEGAAKVNDVTIAKLPLASKAPSAPGKVTEASGHDVAAKVNDLPAHKLALGAHAPAAKTVAGVSGLKADDLKSIANKGNKSAADKNVSGVAANKAGNNTVKNNLSAPAVKATGVKPVADKTAMNVPARKPVTGKKVVQKLVLLERYVRLSPNEGYYHIDTISMESLTEELGPENESKPYFPKAAKRAGIAGVESNDNAATADGQILPGASASSNGKPALGTKEAAAKKSGGGSSALENLAAAFNDLKYKASGVKFIPGLAAGINGTFFAPTSFKGFQFGFTGNFQFGNEWSVATGLEYFHRINGNYAMTDNYYNYVAIPASQGGGYNKQEIDNSYSFSTLHSIEMPVAAKYTNGNFSFIAGANLVYNFAINTGRYTPPVQGNSVYSPVIANDAAPKLDATNFSSRFGIGCLFGVSYQVNQKVSLDVRDVQTLWDNAHTSGAKYVSDQLYKNPSLQLSIGYRLGKAKK